MDQEKKKMLVPKWRFPEFREAGDWEEKHLFQICEINPAAKKLPENFIYIDLESVETGVLLQKKVVPLKGAPSRAQRLLKSGDIIFQTVRPYQKNNFLFQAEDGLDYVASTGYAQLRATQSNRYLYQYIHNENFVNRVLKKCTGSNYPVINSSDLARILIEIPTLPEQQKIATLLTTLDHLIAAQHEKISALQRHKKGLMQQLFPAEGERVPRVRFGGFEGEWEERRLGDMAIAIKEKAGDKIYTLLSITAGIGLISQVEKFGREIAGDSYNNYIVINKGDFAYNKSSTKQHPEGQIALLENAEVGAVPSSIFTCFRVNRNLVLPYFLKYPFSNNIHGNWLKKFIKVGARAHGALSVDLKDLFATPIYFPSLSEQQKIATFLTTLDDLIAAQIQKREALKRQKKGLMQGVFPNIHETEASHTTPVP